MLDLSDVSDLKPKSCALNLYFPHPFVILQIGRVLICEKRQCGQIGVDAIEQSPGLISHIDQL